MAESDELGKRSSSEPLLLMDAAVKPSDDADQLSSISCSQNAGLELELKASWSEPLPLPLVPIDAPKSKSKSDSTPSFGLGSLL
jgi:hypothetical protein